DYVLAVAEERNLRRAAARLYISQPGLTAYLNKLEQHLGVKLFDRNAKPIQITEAGALYIAKMKEIQKSETMLRMTLQDMGAPRRTLRIGMGMTRGMQWLPILVPAFQKIHPDVSIHVQDGGLKDMDGGIIDGSLDVAFGALTSAYQDITYEDIRREYIYCVIPRASACGSGFAVHEATIYHPARITGQELEGETFLMPSPTNGFYEFTNKMLSQQDIHPTNTVMLGNLDTAYHMAAKGCGVLLVNAFDYHRIYPHLDTRLAFCIFSSPPMCRLSKVAYKENSANRDLVKDVIHIVRQELLPIVEEGAPAF
ncbi:MAG: LysR family transcriptional regulator, partial [Lachnospiraceae bacterium]|nr:LysR family transcriptional regulator [Lachnospiraceae bacterium]